MCALLALQLVGGAAAALASSHGVQGTWDSTSTDNPLVDLHSIWLVEPPTYAWAAKEYNYRISSPGGDPCGQQFTMTTTRADGTAASTTASTRWDATVGACVSFFTFYVALSAADGSTSDLAKISLHTPDQPAGALEVFNIGPLQDSTTTLPDCETGQDPGNPPVCEESDPADCGFLSTKCMVDFFLNIDDWVLGLFTPSAANQAWWGGLDDEFSNRMPFALVSQPISWARSTLGGCGVNLCPDTFYGRPYFKMMNPLGPGGPGGDEWHISLLDDNNAQGHWQNLRPVIGVLLYGSFLLGLAMWAFKRYSPGAGGGGDG